MYFLVDYENTGSRGLKGAACLCPEDSVVIFYSDCCRKIEYGVLQELLDSRCTLELCILDTPRKNALDFYIASRIGEICADREAEPTRIAVVSRDGGFKSVQEYWEKKARNRKDIIVSESIECCIRDAGANDFRTKQLERSLKIVDLRDEAESIIARNSDRESGEEKNVMVWGHEDPDRFEH